MTKYEDKIAKRIIEQYEELPASSQQAILDEIKYKNILSAAEEIKKTGTAYFGDLYFEAEERSKHFNKFEGMMTGLRYFDDATMGLRAGELIIIAGASNIGKTMIGMNVCLNAAINNQKKLLIISLEMTAGEVAGRLYAMHDNHEAMMESIVIQTNLSVNTNHVQAMINRHKPDLVLIDHLQFLANQERFSSEYERVSSAIAKVKRIALDNKLPVVLISHVAKTRSGGHGEATAADLKGASNVEQDCDVGLMLNQTDDQRQWNELYIKNFKHRTKRPKLFHKRCTIIMDGVRIADEGNYTMENEQQSSKPLTRAYKWST